MANAKECDRCGKYYSINFISFDYEEDWWRYGLYRDCYPYEEIKVDLCPECRKKLYDWLKEGE